MCKHLRRTVPLLVVLTFLVGATSAGASVPFSVTIDKPERSLDTVAFTTFEIHVVNAGADTLRVRASRLLNALPDDAWSSSICSFSTCYPPDVDSTEFETVPSGGMTGFTIHVMTGRRYGDTARIRVRIDTGPGTASIEREILIATAPRPVQLFRIESQEIEKTVAVGETAEFTVWAYNQAGDTLSMTVARAQDFYTSEGWESTLCVEDSCATPNNDMPPHIVLDVDKATYFKLKVRPGAPGQGRIVLRFNTGRGTEPIEKRFTINAGVAVVLIESDRVMPAHPNPAHSTLTLPLSNAFSAGANVALVISRVDGAEVRRLSRTQTSTAPSGRAVVILDVADMAAGSYVYRIQSPDDVITGQFHVAR